MCQAHHVGHAHPFNIAADLFVILLSVSSLFAVFPPSVKRNIHLKNDVILFQANSYSLHCEMENGHAANRQLGKIIFFLGWSCEAARVLSCKCPYSIFSSFNLVSVMSLHLKYVYE